MKTYPCPKCGKTIHRQGGYRHERACDGTPRALRPGPSAPATAAALRTPAPPQTDVVLGNSVLRLVDACGDLRLAIAEVVRDSIDQGLADGFRDASTTLLTAPAAPAGDITAAALARVERELADPRTFDGRKSWLRDQAAVLRAKLTARTAPRAA